VARLTEEGFVEVRHRRGMFVTKAVARPGVRPGAPSPRPGFVDGPARLKNLSLDVQSKAGRVDAAVVGDSHAQSLFPGLAAADPARTWLAIGNYSCPPTLGIAVESDASECAQKMRQALAAYSDAEDLIQLGAYAAGANPQLDAAIRLRPEMLDFLRQDHLANNPMADTLNRLQSLAARLDQAPPLPAKRA